MRKILYLAAAAALLTATSSAAQTTPGVINPYIPLVNQAALALGDRGAAPAAVSTTNPLPTTNRGVGAFSTAQVTVGTTATLVAAQRVGRQRITVSVGGANACSFGTASVTATTGFPLQPVAGATLGIDTSGAVYAVCTASTVVSVLETY